jgi:hypothetical protein
MESPPDGASSSYPILWNAFKRLAAGYSPSEKAMLFRGTGNRVYRLTEASKRSLVFWWAGVALPAATCALSRWTSPRLARHRDRYHPCCHEDLRIRHTVGALQRAVAPAPVSAPGSCIPPR